MKIFKNFTGIVAPIDRSNIDTDAIIPKQYLKSIKRTGFGVNLFDEWRYLDSSTTDAQQTQRIENPDFILNQPRYRNTEILLTRKNFGCGSSREHAVWSCVDYGIKTIIAPSFADIFYTNAFKNGLLLITFNSTIIDDLFIAIREQTEYCLGIDLHDLQVTKSNGEQLTFELDSELQKRLLQGLDDIAMILNHTDQIKAYEHRRKQQVPWLFNGLSSTKQ